MWRPLRIASGGLVYYVVNRVNAGQTLFDDEGDSAACERAFTQACEEVSMRLLREENGVRNHCLNERE